MAPEADRGAAFRHARESSLGLFPDPRCAGQPRPRLPARQAIPDHVPYRSPNLNAFCERCVRSIKEERLGRLIFFGERSLRRAVSEYAAHYHEERNHQGLGNRLIDPEER